MVVGVAPFLILTFESVLELTAPVRAVVALGLGLLFVVFGRNVWRGIEEMDRWS